MNFESLMPYTDFRKGKVCLSRNRSYFLCLSDGFDLSFALLVGLVFVCLWCVWLSAC